MVASKLLAIVPFIVAASASDYAPGKRGLATNDVGVDLYGFRTTFFEQSKVRWQYNWDSDCSNRVDFTEFVPMLWSDAYDHTRQWDEHVRKWLGQGTQHLLAFNEPDGVPNQSNMTVNQAVNAYRQYMHPYGGSARLGAPAVSNGGWNWISQFMNQCSGCQIDFIPVHWYNQWWQEDDFERWVNQICSLGRPVWITEVGAFSSSSAICRQ